MRVLGLFALFIFFLGLVIMLATPKTFAVDGVLQSQGEDLMSEKPETYPIAMLAGGCFWCLESEFRAKDGVLYTRVGYIGGKTKNPDYRSITTGQTGHAEAVEITFDPEKITYEELIRYFLAAAHDPTQLNRQGVDVGTQYRSEIFYYSDEQKQTAEDMIKAINAEKLYSSPIVTKVSEADTFWLGEDYHQQYYEKYEQQKGSIHPRVIYKKNKKKLKGQ